MKNVNQCLHLSCFTRNRQKLAQLERLGVLWTWTGLKCPMHHLYRDSLCICIFVVSVLKLWVNILGIIYPYSSNIILISGFDLADLADLAATVKGNWSQLSVCQKGDNYNKGVDQVSQFSKARTEKPCCHISRKTGRRLWLKLNPTTSGHGLLAEFRSTMSIDYFAQ